MAVRSSPWVVPALLSLLLATAACSTDDGTGSDVTARPGSAASESAGSAPTSGTPAEGRAVTIHTTACGHASGTTGSGVIVGQANVLTAAHVVIGATEVFVDGADAVVFYVDPTRDLALLKVPGVGMDVTPIELAEAARNDEVRIVGGSSSGTVTATVERRVVMDVDDVRATTRSKRSGYELDAAIAGGDSGAGVFGPDDRLAGIVFAIPSERTDAAFVVGATEIEAVLASTDHAEHRCDPAGSRLVSAADPGS